MLMETELASMNDIVADGEFERKKGTLLTIKGNLDAYYQRLLDEVNVKGETAETPDQEQADDTEAASSNPDE